jgi:hypothetical protein
MRND